MDCSVHVSTYVHALFLSWQIKYKCAQIKCFYQIQKASIILALTKHHTSPMEFLKTRLGNKHLWWSYITEAKKDWILYIWLFEVLMWEKKITLSISVHFIAGVFVRTESLGMLFESLSVLKISVFMFVCTGRVNSCF